MVTINHLKQLIDLIDMFLLIVSNNFILGKSAITVSAVNQFEIGTEFFVMLLLVYQSVILFTKITR